MEKFVQNDWKSLDKFGHISYDVAMRKNKQEQVIGLKYGFFGGVHPKENKEYTENGPVQELPQPEVLTVPMVQHIGAPCQPLVKRGDSVTVGQKIGDGPGLCVPVHAPVSGTVTAVGARPHPGGTTVMSVVIQNDHENTLCPDIHPRTAEEIAALSREQRLDIIREAGIAGMGGAAFPTYAKLSSGLGKVRVILVNLSECEPYITADDQLTRLYAPEILDGLEILMGILEVREAHIGIEENKPRAIEALRRAMEGREGMILDVLPCKYPQGAEKQLIQAITGREVPSGGLPAAVGCAVFNGGTCKAVRDAIWEGMPLIRRIVTVSGDALEQPRNFLVPLGTSFETLIRACGLKDQPYKVLCGGPMMGLAQYDLSVTVIKGCNAVTVLNDSNRHYLPHPHCIRCGRCIDACPMHLMPLQMYRAEQSHHVERMKQEHILDCIECGSCAYVCPARIPLVQSFRAAKQRIRSAQTPKKAPAEPKKEGV